MTSLSNFIGQAALQSFFPQYSQQTPVYNPQYNGWDCAEDMPMHHVPKKNQQKQQQKTQQHLYQGEKLNAQLVNQILKPSKPKQEQEYKANNGWGNFYGGQVTNNQQFYNKPIPYTPTVKENASMKAKVNTPQQMPQTNYTPTPAKQPQQKPPQKPQTQNYQNPQSSGYTRRLTADEMDSLLS